MTFVSLHIQRWITVIIRNIKIAFCIKSLSRFITRRSMQNVTTWAYMYNAPPAEFLLIQASYISRDVVDGKIN